MLIRTIFFSLSLCLTAYAAPTPDQASQMLQEGNARFVTGKIIHKSYAEEAKSALVEKQTPFAVIVGCSDSRVPPELVFDRGIGELFTVRIAGNVIGPVEMDSVEYAVTVLKVPLVMVLGHQNCGAVKAALEGQGEHPELEAIVPLIDAALETCDTTGKLGLQNAIYCNVNRSVATLKESPAIAPLLKQGKLKIVGAYYEIATEKVSIIEK